MDVTRLILSNTAVKAVKKQFEKGTASHAYIIEGEKGLLPQLLRTLSAFAVCDSHGCMSCNACNKAIKGIHQDVKYYPPELTDRKTLQVEDAINVIGESIVQPVESDAKVFLLNAAVNQQGNPWQSKLLKVLEETPPSVYIFIGTTNESELLETVRSRCFIVHVDRSTEEDISNYLVDGGFSEDASQLAAALSGGNVFSAESLILSGKLNRLYDDVSNTLKNMGSTKESLPYVSRLMQYGGREDARLMLEMMELLLRESIAVNNSPSQCLLSSKKADIMEIANNYSDEACIRIIALIEDAAGNLAMNCSYLATLDNLILKILEVKYRCRK